MGDADARQPPPQTAPPPPAWHGSARARAHPLCPPPPPRVTFRWVAVSLRGPGQSPVRPFACCVGVAAFCRPLRPVLLLVSFPRSRSPVVGVPGLCWMWRDVPFAHQRRPVVGVLGLCWLLRGSFDCLCQPPRPRRVERCATAVRGHAHGSTQDRGSAVANTRPEVPFCQQDGGGRVNGCRPLSAHGPAAGCMNADAALNPVTLR